MFIKSAFFIKTARKRENQQKLIETKLLFGKSKDKKRGPAKAKKLDIQNGKAKFVFILLRGTLILEANFTDVEH